MTTHLATCLHHIHESLILVVLRIFFILFFLNAIYGAALIFVFFSNVDLSYRPIAFSSLSIIHSLIFFIELFFIILVVVRWATKVYYLTEHQLIKRVGLLKNEEYSYELTHIRAVQLRQSFLGKMLGYGDLFLTLATSGYREDVKINDVADPKKYERVLREYIEKAITTNNPLSEEQK